MKTEFPILNISPTQWVLVDKTRIPRDGEPYCHLIERLGSYCLDQRAVIHDSFYRPGLDLPILAAYPKIEIEGVLLLLPSLLWEKRRTAEELAFAEYPYTEGDLIGFKTIQNNKHIPFIKGYEAAGGYTSNQIFGYPEWLIKNEYFNYKSFDDTMRWGIFEKYLASLRPVPRALVIDVNEDGSMPSENGAIIYTEVIY